MKTIEQYTTDELSSKIQAIKAEREKTANALKRYEEELEKRKQEVPLGVPSDGKCYVDWKGEVNIDRFEKAEEVAYNSFSSYESAEKHAEMLLAWRKALIANAKGEPIDIQVLLPLLPKGYVAMDKDEDWFWYQCKPRVTTGAFWDFAEGWSNKIFGFNLKPAENWKTSLMECGL